MFSDKKIIFVIEYIIGFSLLIIVLPHIIYPQPGWGEAYWWAYLLFIVSSGFILISCASETKQRMQMAERIAKLEKMMEEHKATHNQPQDQTAQKRTTSEPRHIGVGSVN
jgi:hypothetical protein